MTKASFEQHFWTFKIIFTVLKKSPQLRKASVEVGKFSFVFSQNNSVKQRVQEKMYRQLQLRYYSVSRDESAQRENEMDGLSFEPFNAQLHLQTYLW